MNSLASCLCGSHSKLRTSTQRKLYNTTQEKDPREIKKIKIKKKAEGRARIMEWANYTDAPDSTIDQVEFERDESHHHHVPHSFLFPSDMEEEEKTRLQQQQQQQEKKKDAQFGCEIIYM